MTQTIRVSSPAGAVEYTWPTTITSDHDIHLDTIEISLGSYTAPGAWVAPSSDPAQSDNKTRVVRLLVDSSAKPGTYYVWVRLTDSPEIVPRRGARIDVI